MEAIAAPPPPSLPTGPESSPPSDRPGLRSIHKRPVNQTITEGRMERLNRWYFGVPFVVRAGTTEGMSAEGQSPQDPLVIGQSKEDPRMFVAGPDIIKSDPNQRVSLGQEGDTLHIDIAGATYVVGRDDFAQDQGFVVPMQEGQSLAIQDFDPSTGRIILIKGDVLRPLSKHVVTADAHRGDTQVPPGEFPGAYPAGAPANTAVETSEPQTQAHQETPRRPSGELPPLYTGSEEKMRVLNEQDVRVPFHLRKGEQATTLPFQADGSGRIIMPDDVRTIDTATTWVLQQSGDRLIATRGNIQRHFTVEDLQNASAQLDLNDKVLLGVTHFDVQTGTVEVYKAETPDAVSTLTKSNFAREVVKRISPLVPISIALQSSEPMQVPAAPLDEPPAIEQPAEVAAPVEEIKRGRKVDYSASTGPESFAGHVAHDLARAQSAELRDIEGTNPDGSPITPLRSDDARYQLVDRSLRTFLREQTGTDNRAAQDALFERMVEIYHEQVVDPDNVVHGDEIAQGGVFWYREGMPEPAEIAAMAKTAMAHEMAERAMQSAGTGNYGPTTATS